MDLNQVLHLRNMSYYHRSKVTYTTWFDQSISNQLEITFRKKLTEGINNIKSSENLLIFADKTTNLYEMTPEQYKTILTNNVTKTYRKAERSTQLNIDREAKTISKTLQLEKRMEHYAEWPAFISLKDHKENFKQHKMLSY